MLSQCKCKKCSAKSLEVDYWLTIQEYNKEYSIDIRAVLPYNSPPIVPEYLVLVCTMCNEVYRVSHDEVVKMIRYSCAELAWVRSRRELGTPEHYDGYLKKYIVDKGLHKGISEVDRERNTYLDEILKYAEEKLTKKRNN